MPFIELDNIDDERLHVYRHLKKTNMTRWSSQFIAEGKKLVVQLLQSDFAVQSILTSDKHVAFLEPHLPNDIPAYVLPHTLAQLLVGFSFHCGMLGCGLRKQPPSLDELMTPDRRHLLVVLPRTQDLDNMGSIIRTAAGFGATAVLTGAGSCDPFSRKALRVSMGNTLRLPVLEMCDELAPMLQQLRTDHSVELFATLLDESAELLSDVRSTGNCALLFGNEDSGLTPDWINLCDRRVTIPMHGAADSFNVSIAAGISMFHFANEATAQSPPLRAERPKNQPEA